MSGVAQAWGDAVAACTVGADRAGVPPLPGALEGMAASSPDGLLATAAALGTWRLAGAVPRDAKAVPVAPMEDAVPECSDAAAARLELLLAGREPQLPTCREWCRLAAAARVRVPPGLAERLFTVTRRQDWAAEADQVIGARLPWLRTLDGAALPEADWSAAELPRRRAALRLMRAEDPATARDALSVVWKTEPADVRAALLAALEAGLDAADEPFLESCLDDRSASVRTEASRLLAFLPGSGWSLRMQARAAAAVQFRPGRLLSRDTVAVTLPAGDKAAQRDGLDVKEEAGWKSRLLRQVVAAAPMAVWEAAPPPRWIAAAMAGEWAATLVPGWAAAAARERDTDWAGALLDALADTWPEQPMSHGRVWGFDALKLVAPVMPPYDLERAVGSTLHRTDTVPASTLELCDHAWSLKLTRWVLDWIAAEVSRTSNHILHHAVHGMLNLVATRGSVDAAAQLQALAAELPENMVPTLHRSLAEAVSTLAFRQAMHQEFNR